MRREAPWASTGGRQTADASSAPEFKRTAVQRILTGEKTLAELSRELDISPSVIRQLAVCGGGGDDGRPGHSEDVVPTSHLRERSIIPGFSECAASGALAWRFSATGNLHNCAEIQAGPATGNLSPFVAGGSKRA